MMSTGFFFVQRAVKQNVSSVGIQKILLNKFSAQAVAVITMVGVWSHLLIWHLLSGWAGSVQIVKSVRVAGLLLS